MNGSDIPIRQNFLQRAIPARQPQSFRSSTRLVWIRPQYPRDADSRPPQAFDMHRPNEPGSHNGSGQCSGHVSIFLVKVGWFVTTGPRKE